MCRCPTQRPNRPWTRYVRISPTCAHKVEWTEEIHDVGSPRATLSVRAGAVLDLSRSVTPVFMQAFVRDPDGYYIEFCNCDTLEKYLHDLAESRAQEEWNIIKTHSLLRAGKMLKQRAHDSKNIVQQRTMRKDIKDEDSDNVGHKKRDVQSNPSPSSLGSITSDNFRLRTKKDLPSSLCIGMPTPPPPSYYTERALLGLSVSDLCPFLSFLHLPHSDLRNRVKKRKQRGRRGAGKEAVALADATGFSSKMCVRRIC